MPAGSRAYTALLQRNALIFGLTICSRGRKLRSSYQLQNMLVPNIDAMRSTRPYPLTPTPSARQPTFNAKNRDRKRTVLEFFNVAYDLFLTRQRGLAPDGLPPSP